MPRSAHPSATIFGFGMAKHEEREGRNRSCASARECAPHNDPHKLPKPPSVGSAAEPPSGGSKCMASWWLHIVRSEASVSRGSHHSVLRQARGRRLCSL